MKRPYTNPSLIDTIISMLTYITMGFAGVIWMVLCAIMRREMSSFVRYHVFQSVFISLGLYLLNILCGIIVGILSFIPFIKTITHQIMYLLNMPIFMNYSLIQTVIYTVLIYLVATAACGFYSYIPFISDIIYDNVERK